MKRYLLFLLIVLPATAGFGQQQVALPRYMIGCGEYQVFFLNTSTGKLYGISSNMRLLARGDNDGEPGLPAMVAIPRNLRIKAVASGLHNSAAVDNNGEVWTWGSNENAQGGVGTTENPTDDFPRKITQDSLGRPFTGVVQVACWANQTAEGVVAVKDDGTVWIWGKTGGGFRGNGQYGGINKRPVRVDIPAGKKVVKVVAAEIILALTSDGSVYSWGGDNRPFLLGRTGVDFRRPAKINLPKPAKDIAGASYISYALGTDGKLYGWGYAGSYLGVGKDGYKGNTPVAVPRDLSNELRLPKPVMAVTTNSVSTHVILSDSTLWGWGDNATGCIGNGEELDYANHMPPYAWDFGPAQLFVQKPVRIAPSVHNFTHVFGGSAYVFYTYAETADGRLFSWGRNKGGVLGNGVIGASPQIMSVYPNSWDIPLATEVDPFALKRHYISTSPYCLLNPEGSPCNEYSPPEGRKPVADAGSVEQTAIRGTIRLDARKSYDPDGRIVYYRWAQTKGPRKVKLDAPGSELLTLNNLLKGDYEFLLKVTDNSWSTDSVKVKVVVSN
ncbi:MAG: hypothetical protein JST42_08135 [Bacteroidetes bacterium]|nr:hypothetical protein [Bacteroidota bacterium]